MTNKSPAVAKKKPAFDGPVQLSSGYWAIVRPVAPSLIADVQSEIDDPEVPKVFIEDKGRHEDNPSDPTYLRALERAENDRMMAALDVMVLFGFELVEEDGSPFEIPEGNWIRNLRYLEKRGRINLSEYDLEDPYDREFLFKRFVAIGNQDIGLASKASGMTEEDIAKAEKSFQGQT
jgi:hypothetical protein